MSTTPLRRRRTITVGRARSRRVLVPVVLIVTLFPFYWMLRTAFSDNTQLPGHPNSLLPGGDHARRVQAGAGAVDDRGGAGAGRLRRGGELLAVPAQLVGRGDDHDGLPGVLQRDGGVRVRPAALARPGQGVRVVPGRADGAADLHHAAELRADQEPRAAEQLRRHHPAGRCS